MTIDHINLMKNVFYSFIGGVASAILISYILGYRIKEWVTKEILIFALVIIILMFLSALIFEVIMEKGEKTINKKKK